MWLKNMTESLQDLDYTDLNLRKRRKYIFSSRQR